jgi:predicted nucleic acid-binding protein
MVIDSSVALAWVLNDEKNAATEGILDRVVNEGAWVPALWRLEIANTLQQAVKRRRLDKAGRDSAILSLANLSIAIDPDTNTFAWSRTLELADRFGLTSYDASYLELAQRRALPLATLDQELRAAGRKLGISLM